MDGIEAPDGYEPVNPEDVLVGDQVFIVPGPGVGLVGPLEVQSVDGELYAVSPDHTIPLGTAGITIYGKNAPMPVEVHEEFDETARVVRTVTADGVLVSTRPFSADENATADAQVAAAADAAAVASIQEALVSSMTDLQTILDTAPATLNAGPAAAIKTLARTQRRAIRLLAHRLDGTS